jgi:hypothetical protein
VPQREEMAHREEMPRKEAMREEIPRKEDIPRREGAAYGEEIPRREETSRVKETQDLQYRPEQALPGQGRREGVSSMQQPHMERKEDLPEKQGASSMQ